MVHPAALRGNHRRMHNGVQFVKPSALKSYFRQPRTVQSAIGADDLRTKRSHNFGVNRLPRLHQRTAQFIGLDNLGAQRAQSFRNSAFAAAQSAGKANSQHRFAPPPLLSRLIFVARTVLAISMATVSRPTPPGTGV